MSFKTITALTSALLLTDGTIPSDWDLFLKFMQMHLQQESFKSSR